MSGEVFKVADVTAGADDATAASSSTAMSDPLEETMLSQTYSGTPDDMPVVGRHNQSDKLTAESISRPPSDHLSAYPQQVVPGLQDGLGARLPASDSGLASDSSNLSKISLILDLYRYLLQDGILLDLLPRVLPQFLPGNPPWDPPNTRDRCPQSAQIPLYDDFKQPLGCICEFCQLWFPSRLAYRRHRRNSRLRQVPAWKSKLGSDSSTLSELDVHRYSSLLQGGICLDFLLRDLPNAQDSCFRTQILSLFNNLKQPIGVECRKCRKWYPRYAALKEHRCDVRRRMPMLETAQDNCIHAEAISLYDDAKQPLGFICRTCRKWYPSRAAFTRHEFDVRWRKRMLDSPKEHRSGPGSDVVPPHDSMALDNAQPRSTRLPRRYKASSPTASPQTEHTRTDDADFGRAARSLHPGSPVASPTDMPGPESSISHKCISAAPSAGVASSSEHSKQSWWCQDLHQVWLDLWTERFGSPSSDPSRTSDDSFDDAVRQSSEAREALRLCYGVDKATTYRLLSEFEKTAILLFKNDACASSEAQEGGPTDTGGATETMSGKKRSAPSMRSGGQRQKQQKKTVPSQNNSEEDGGDDDDGNDGSGSQGMPTDKMDAVPLSFACPFYKRWPERYSKCRELLANTSRVKQHLKRYHEMIPFYCAECYLEFEDEKARDYHSREVNCKILPEREREGTTKKQRDLLGKPTKAANTSPEAWFEIWDILFPGVDCESGPFMDCLTREVLAFQDYLFCEGPRIWDLVVARHVSGKAVCNDQEVRILFRNAFLETLRATFLRYQSRQAAVQTTSSSLPITERHRSVDEGQPASTSNSPESHSGIIPDILESSPSSSAREETQSQLSSASEHIVAREAAPEAAQSSSPVRSDCPKPTNTAPSTHGSAVIDDGSADPLNNDWFKEVQGCADFELSLADLLEQPLVAYDADESVI